jgi:hypothetical protein
MLLGTLAFAMLIAAQFCAICAGHDFRRAAAHDGCAPVRTSRRRRGTS